MTPHVGICRDYRRAGRPGRGRADRGRHGADHRRHDLGGRRAGLVPPSGCSVVDATGKWVLPGLRRRAHPPRRPRGGRGLGRTRHQRAHRPGPGPRAGARRDQPGRRGVPRRAGRRRAGGRHHPRLGQPDRRPDGGGPLLGADRGRHGAPLPGRDEVRARREPQARARRAAGQPVQPPRHRRRDQVRAGGRGRLPGQRRRSKARRCQPGGTTPPNPPGEKQWVRTVRGACDQGSETRGAGPRAPSGDPVAAALPPGRRHRHRAPAGGRVRLRPGPRPLHRGVPAGGEDRRGRGAGGDRPADHRPVQGRAAEPHAGQPGRARRGRDHGRDRDRPPGGPGSPAHPAGGAGGEGGHGPGRRRCAR